MAAPVEDLEVGLADSLIQSLFPAEPPRLPGYSIAARMDSRSPHAGNFFGCFPLSPSEWVFAIGDSVISSKRSGRGLFAAACLAFLQIRLKQVTELPRLMQELNCFLHGELEENSFCMCSLLKLNTQTQEVEHVGAGHQVYLLDTRARLAGRLESTGLPLALFPEADFGVNRMVFSRRGEHLLMLTDGYQETISPDHRLFGMEQVFHILHDRHTEPVEQVLAALQQQAAQFQSGLTTRDDRAAILIRRV